MRMPARNWPNKSPQTVLAKGEILLAQKIETHDSLEDLMFLMEGMEGLPVISVSIDEQHVGQRVLGPGSRDRNQFRLVEFGL